jgi:hypothetical protein
MRHRALLLVTILGCASTAAEQGPGGIPRPPTNGGKTDGTPIQCGASQCDAALCGWDCSTAGQACAKTCTTDGRANAFVTATASGAESTTIDSRATPYMPVWSLDNVLIYGCELWAFQDGKQGLEIELTELIHDPFVVDPNDPARYQRKLDIYADAFA